MELVNDRHPILNGVSLNQMGCDSVLLHDTRKNRLYFCGHFKDFKPGDRKFIDQITALLSVVEANADKEFFLMCDANTQFVIEEGALVAYSKDDSVKPSDPAKFHQFIMKEGIRITGVIAGVPTSNKMRGAHTAQQDKSFKRVTAAIDHVLGFNCRGRIVSTEVYVLGDSGKLERVQNADTMTTSPISIPDHAFVVSTYEDGDVFATGNIKGGKCFS